MYKTTDCISTFDYIQTEKINMKLKQSYSKNYKGKIIIYIGQILYELLMGLIICGQRYKGQKTRWTKMHRTN